MTPAFSYTFGLGVLWVVGHFSKSQNLIVDVAKKATLVVLNRKFVEFLDRVLFQLNKKIRG